MAADSASSDDHPKHASATSRLDAIPAGPCLRHLSLSVARPSTMFMPQSSLCVPGGGSPRDTCTALNRRGGPRPITFNDGINNFTAEKAAPPVYQVGAPQFSQQGSYHEPLAARATHRHWIYVPFPVTCAPFMSCKLARRPLDKTAYIRHRNRDNSVSLHAGCPHRPRLMPAECDVQCHHGGHGPQVCPYGPAGVAVLVMPPEG